MTRHGRYETGPYLLDAVLPCPGRRKDRSTGALSSAVQPRKRENPRLRHRRRQAGHAGSIAIAAHPILHGPRFSSAAPCALERHDRRVSEFQALVVPDGRPYRLSSIAIASQQVAVRIDTTVAQERPDATYILAAAQIDLGHEQLRLIDRGLGEDLALRP